MAHPFPLFDSIWTPSREIAVTPDVTKALKNGATVAIGVSGGKAPQRRRSRRLII